MILFDVNSNVAENNGKVAKLHFKVFAVSLENWQSCFSKFAHKDVHLFSLVYYM